MVTLDLSQEEAEVLLHLLEVDLSDLHMEIAATDRRSYRDMLRAKKVLLRTVTDRLRVETSARPAQFLPRELHPEV